MKEKIEWYREVLELEPGSKVFFPLARLLAESGQLQDALSALRLGLERHPEFIEARLYLIELLYKNGQIAQCESQVGQLTRLFSKYPGFWDAWGACAATTEKKPDISLTLRFLAALFQHPDVGLGEVLEKGLNSLAAPPVAMPPLSDCSAETDEKNFSPDDVTVSSGMSAVDVPSAAVMTHDGEEADDAEESFTLRTKSMADVLAGQSDISGALEIYHELASRAGSPEERREINERIAHLSSLRNQAVDAPSHTPPLAHPPGKQRMRFLLESLAERLEARALG